MAILLTFFYVWIFVEQMGAPVPAEYWVYETKQLKESEASRIHDPKIVVVAGSSALFGIDTDTISELTHRPTMNMALHASLSLDWLLKYADRNTLPGDVIVMPLEYRYFVSDPFKPTKWMATQVVAWDPQYFYNLGLLQKTNFIASVSFWDVFDNLVIQLSRAKILQENPSRSLRSIDALMLEWERGVAPHGTYSFMNIKLDGDINENCGSNPPLSISDEAYSLSPTSTFNSAALAALVRATREMRMQDKSLFFSFQPVARNSVTSLPWFTDQIATMAQIMRQAGISVLGRPKDYYFDQDEFFDTSFHLNCDSRIRRSVILGSQILNGIADPRR